MAIARLHTGVGRELDLGLLPRLRLGGSEGRAPAGDGELCAPPEPVLRPATLRRPPWWRLAAARPNGGRCLLPSRRRRSAIARIVPGCTSLADLSLRPDQDVLRLVGHAVRAAGVRPRIAS